MSDSTESSDAGGPVPAEADGPVSQPHAAATGRPGLVSRLGRIRRGFRAWRRSRPFWAGVLLVIAGAELLLIPLPVHDMGVILHIGVGGVSGILIGAVLILIGLLLWFHAAQHIFYSIVAVLLAIAALVASNLGGFLLGTVLGIIGGSLGFAWMPGRPERRRRPRQDRPGAAPDDGIGMVAGADTEAQAEASVGPDTPTSASTRTAAVDPLAAFPRAEHEHGTTLRAFALIPVLALLLAPLAGLIHFLDPGSAASSSPSACSTTTASPAPGSSPSASCSPAPAASTDPTPDPTPAPSPSAGPDSDPNASTSATPSGTSPSPTPTGTPPSFAVSAAESTLTASSATITGFAYDGVVTVPTVSGSVQMMQFSATSLDLTGVRLSVSQGGGTQTTTAATLNLTGNVVLYTTELSGDLLGIPLTITPSTPIADILQALGEAGLSQTLTQVVPLPMTNVTTLQPYTSADGMSVSALDIS